MIRRSFLSRDDRARLTSIARDRLEDHRTARRAHVILALERGRTCEKVSEARMNIHGVIDLGTGATRMRRLCRSMREA